ncbi:MAG: DNA repair ATPase, partial [Planctomycetales bacterium]|nr:DNA repair ATPase [Planctomycetales bacterium]
KTERTPSDVFAIYARGEGGFAPDDLALISDERFVRDFAEIYRYYKDAVFAKFALRGPYLYMVFRVGRDITDVKAFKWAVQGDELVYVDNRSEHEIRYPPQHDFEWRRTTRDMHRSGRHPHISIEDRLFVETVGGDLTIKVENNTESGEGIYAEPVDHADQTLDDAEIYYAVVGSLILLKIKPYQESTFRYIVYNEKLEAARRLDAIGDACILLPDDQGLIFADGCYLASGECKVFQSGLRNMLFEQRIASPNGEDVLFVFYQRAGGVYVLLRYNVIEQRIETPTICHGFLLFRDGRLVCFRGQDEPSKHHAIQIWRTPFTAEEIPPPPRHADSLLFKIGNRDLVRGMAECRDVLRM